MILEKIIIKYLIVSDDKINMKEKKYLIFEIGKLKSKNDKSSADL